MTDVYSNIQNGKYENTVPLIRGDRKDPAIIAGYKARVAEERRLIEDFYRDCCDDLEIDHEKESSRKIFDRAWEESHSSGLNEVYENMCELVDFVGEVAGLLQKGE